MGAFDKIEVAWKGRNYIIPPRRVMGAIARIEDVLTFAELQAFENRNTIPMAKMAMAYGAVLRYGGAHVTDEEVYETMFAGEAEVRQVADTVVGLMMMMMPLSVRQRVEAALAASGEADAGEHSPGNSVPATTP